MRWHERIIAAHLAVTDKVSHYERLKSDRYFVWREDGANDLESDNIHTERVMTGSTDLYTKVEFDSWIDDFERALNGHGIIWRLNSVQYEEDTRFIHYEWMWEVHDGAD